MAVAGLRRDRFVAAADCEQDCGCFLAQPVNSWSSLGYLAAGAAVFARTGPPGRRRVPGRRGAAAVFAAALAANAPGGVAYHGPGGAFGRWLHDAALVANLSSITVWNVLPTESSSVRPAAAAGSASGLAAGCWPSDRVPAVGCSSLPARRRRSARPAG